MLGVCGSVSQSTEAGRLDSHVVGQLTEVFQHVRHPVLKEGQGLVWPLVCDLLSEHVFCKVAL